MSDRSEESFVEDNMHTCSRRERGAEVSNVVDM